MSSEIIPLAHLERTLIEKALILAKGNVTVAYEINVPNKNYMSYRTYLDKINHKYKINKKCLKTSKPKTSQKQSDNYPTQKPIRQKP